MKKHSSNVLVVVPTYKNGHLLYESISDLANYFSEVMIVFDGKDDLCVDLSNIDTNIKKIVCDINQGQGAALQSGLEFAQKNAYDFVVTFDGDTQHSALDAYDMVAKALKDDIDYISGTRFSYGGKCEKIPILKRYVLLLASKFENLVLDKKLTDSHNGLRVIKCSVLNFLIPFSCKRRAHATEIIIKATLSNLNILEYPVSIKYLNQDSSVIVDAINVVFELKSSKLISFRSIARKVILKCLRVCTIGSK